MPVHTAPELANLPMRLLQYKDLDLRRVKPAFAKVRAAIEAGDFKSPDVKKLHVGAYYRAKLDHSNRLLLQFAHHGGETVCLALEVIENHAYDKSRFLRGAPVDEAKIDHEPIALQAQSASEAVPLRWLHATRVEFELLDKPIVFDDAQEAVRRLPAPVVLVGSAGSGKTAVTLAKLREAEGRVLYVTQSAYLAQSARALYDAHGSELFGDKHAPVLCDIHRDRGVEPIAHRLERAILRHRRRQRGKCRRCEQGENNRTEMIQHAANLRPQRNTWQSRGCRKA